MTHLALVAVTLVVVYVAMLVEMLLSRAHERVLRARGATEPLDDVYPLMAWAYPGGFVMMAGESALTGAPPIQVTFAGVAAFLAAKALKYWAIAALGERWTFRILVPPSMPLVHRGPYRYVRHPNYVGVMGEIAGVALMVGAPLTGVVVFLGFGVLLRRRIRAEERALGYRPCH